jgi:hypothetical protein
VCSLSGVFMRSVARQIVVAALLAALLEWPAMLDMPAMAAASSPKPLGLVIQADNALLANSTAAIGTTVFSGDALETQDGGTLRLRVGSSQLYLLSSSAATLSQSAAVPQVQVIRGTVGISTIAPEQIEIETPLGTVRPAKGQAAYGQVRLVSPQELIVSAFRGNLSIEFNSESHTIEAGKSYDVTLSPEPQSAEGYNDVTAPKDKRRLLLKAIIVGGMALTGYLLWQEESESCYGFKGC